MSDAASIARLRAVAVRLLERDDVDGTWFAACVAEYQAGARHGLTLGDAFGFRLSRGERGWWEEDVRERRDHLLRQIAHDHFRSLSARTAARQITRGLTLYEGATWRQHRQYASAPPQIVGTARAGYFALLKLGSPVSLATARRALAHEVPDSVSHGGASNAATDSEDTDESNDETATDTAA